MCDFGSMGFRCWAFCWGDVLDAGLIVVLGYRDVELWCRVVVYLSTSR